MMTQFRMGIGGAVMLLGLALGLPTTGHCEDVLASDPSIQLSSVSLAMQESLNAGEFSGSVTAVLHRGELVHLHANGLADIESGRPMDVNTRFSIASMTKPIAATGLMMLVEAGQISIDDSVATYLPAFANVRMENGEELQRSITIRDVLTHTSGLAGSQAVPSTLAEAVDKLAGGTLRFQPGSKWQYSAGLNVAGRIIEVVSQMPLEDYMEQRIFRPLQMSDTTFYPTKANQEQLATIYRPGDMPGSLIPTPNHIIDLDDIRGPSPSGGLISTASDLLKFYRMILDGGTTATGMRIIDRETIDSMTTPVTGDLVTGFTPGNAWGLGWCVLVEPQGVTAMLNPGTFGHGGAFGTQGWIDPVTETVYVLLIQRTKFGNSDASDVRRSFQGAAANELGITYTKMSSTSLP
ncbi:MAG: serine hydrolase domain-containing protein [Planctomycetota bacterium]